MPLHSSTSRRFVIFSFRWSSVNCRLSLAFSWALRRWSISRRTRASILVGSATASEVSTFIMFDSLTVLTTSHHQHFTVLKEIQHDNKTLKGGGGGYLWVGQAAKDPCAVGPACLVIQPSDVAGAFSSVLSWWAWVVSVQPDDGLLGQEAGWGVEHRV